MPLFRVEGDGFGSVPRGEDVVPVGLQGLAGDGEDGGLVVDDENGFAESSRDAGLLGADRPDCVEVSMAGR